MGDRISIGNYFVGVHENKIRTMNNHPGNYQRRRLSCSQYAYSAASGKPRVAAGKETMPAIPIEKLLERMDEIEKECFNGVSRWRALREQLEAEIAGNWSHDPKNINAQLREMLEENE